MTKNGLSFKVNIMADRNEVLEFNILGSPVRISANRESTDVALKAVRMLQDEVSALRKHNHSLRDIDVAVLAALKFASTIESTEAEYKENMLGLKAGIRDALSVIEEVSPGSLGNLV